MLPMWPSLPGFKLQAVNYIDDEFILVARASQATSVCPICKKKSTAVHSWYERTPADLPSCGKVVRLCLQVRRFFCRNMQCSRQIFCERLPQMVRKYARRTLRLAQSLTILAFALGGIGGERIVSKIGMPASRDTLLRLIRRETDAPHPDPRVIGVDDWAFRKGHNYGTLVCDLEHGVVIDLLSDREAETLAEWLKAHPSVKIVARDRSSTYAAGVNEGAPKAIQVADRWHLASNLVEAIEATLARYPSRLHGGPIPEKEENTSSKAPPDAGKQTTVKTDLLAAREAKRVLRLEKYKIVITLRQRGVFLKDIASQGNISHKTVGRWLTHGTFPERKPRASQPTKVDPYRAYVHQRWQEGCHNLAQLYREIKEQGFTGSYSTVFEHFRDLQNGNDDSLPGNLNSGALNRPKRRYSPRQAAFLFIRDPQKLTELQRVDLKLILAENPQFCQWRKLGQQFVTLLRNRDLSALHRWLDDVAKHGSGPMKRFASGLRSDYPEVSAALTYEWSNGPTEGHVNKLKLIKRQMFGRAKLDLLRKRVMYRF
jgi:transposase